MHGNSLDYHKCAFLYANLITYEDEGSEIYAHYRERWKFLHGISWKRRNIDEDLRIIYKRFLVEDEMKQERIKALYDICHAYWITTKVPNMKFYPCHCRRRNCDTESAVYRKGSESVPVFQDGPPGVGSERRTPLYRFYPV